MKQTDIQTFLMRYLQDRNCQILEKTPADVTVKLSPAADRELTGRTYYWNFVERTGAEPETMTFTFIINPEQHQQQEEAKRTAESQRKAEQDARQMRENHAGSAGDSPLSGGQPSSEGTDEQDNSILGRYLGITPRSNGLNGRVIQDPVNFGSRRLEQIFRTVKAGGRFVELFEEWKQAGDPFKRSRASAPFSTWLGVNYKVEYLCDMKRDEIHSLGIDLTTGVMVDQFHERLCRKRLTPRLPQGIHLLRANLDLGEAARYLEQHVQKQIDKVDHQWAVEANWRYEEEIRRIDDYYGELLQSLDKEEERSEAESQYQQRQDEIRWQYLPRIEVHVINCGLFHLSSDDRFIN